MLYPGKVLQTVEVSERVYNPPGRRADPRGVRRIAGDLLKPVPSRDQIPFVLGRRFPLREAHKGPSGRHRHRSTGHAAVDRSELPLFEAAGRDGG